MGRARQALDGANGLDVLDLNLKACRSGFERRLRVPWRAPSESAPIASTPIRKNVQRIAAFYLPECPELHRVGRRTHPRGSSSG